MFSISIKVAGETTRGEMMHLPFFTDETPHCFWNVDRKQKNEEYLNSIEPFYFEYSARVHEPYLDRDDEQAQYSAMAIRTLYSHALETLFALLSAALQAPEAPLAWMVSYRNSELNKFIEALHEGNPRKVFFPIETNDWEGVVRLLIPIAPDEQSEYAFLWRRFAADFLDKKREDEYNSIKHGLRAAPSDHSVSIGPETTPGVPAPPEAMQTISQSRFGISYFSVETIQNRHNFQVKQQRLNWLPQSMLHALKLIGYSITNIVSFLKVYNGADSELVKCYRLPAETFDALWMDPIDTSSFEMNRHTIIPSSVIPMTVEQIKAQAETKKAPVSRETGEGETQN